MYVPGIPVSAEDREPKVDKMCYSAAVRLIAGNMIELLQTAIYGSI